MPSSSQSGTLQTAAVRKPSAYDLYHPCREPVRLFAGVTPGGFRIEEHVYPELRGRVIATRFVRKLFLVMVGGASNACFRGDEAVAGQLPLDLANRCRANIADQ